MARTNGVAIAESTESKHYRLTADISPEFNAHVNLWVDKNDITKTSAIRKFCADGFGYVGTGSELDLIKQSEAAAAAGVKRSASFQETSKKASMMDMLKAKLLAGEEISNADLAALLLG